MAAKFDTRRKQLRMPRTTVAEENMSRWIGRFEERIDNLIDEFKKESQGAAEHRHNLREVIQSFSLSIQALTKEVTDMKPLVFDYREKRDQAIGAAKVTRIIWATTVTLAGAIGAAIVELIRYIRT